MSERRVQILTATALLVLIAIGLGLYRYRVGHAESPKKIAEGTYSVVRRLDSSRRANAEVDSFTLWQGPGRHLKAVIIPGALGIPPRDPAKPHHQTETLEMNFDLSMRRVRYELENSNIAGDGALDCFVGLLSLDCVSTFAESNGKGRINATGGYATQFGAEAALLDFPWFFTTLLAGRERNTNSDKPLHAVTIAFDGQTPDTLITGRVLSAKADYLGTEDIQIMDHAIHAHKFHVSGGKSRDLPDLESTVWVSETGLLLALDWIDERWELTSFIQRDALIAELGVEDDEATAIRTSGQFERHQFVRVQGALWAESGSREESLYMALHGMGLIEVTEDKIGISEGKRFLHVKLTEAGKAAATPSDEDAFVSEFPIASEKILDIRAEHKSEKYHSALYAVTYRWELNELGQRLKDYLPGELTPPDPLSAHVGLRYEKNQWSVDTIQLPAGDALRGR